MSKTRQTAYQALTSKSDRLLEVDIQRGEVLVGCKQLELAALEVLKSTLEVERLERRERRRKLLSEISQGDIRKGIVKNFVDFGAFIDLNGLDCLLRITDMSWSRVSHPSVMFKVGQEIDVIVLEVNRDKGRVSLGIKQLLANPWDSIAQKFSVGTKVKGKVVNLVGYGAFVELEPGIEGLIHVSELSWTRKINHPSEIFKKGEEIEAVVLKIDPPNQRISLGVKQLTEDPWTNIDKYYKVGEVVTAKVSKLCGFGAFVGLAHDIDGLVHKSQVGDEPIDDIKNMLTVGQEVTARVIKIDTSERHVALSMRAVNYTAEQLKEEQRLFELLKPDGTVFWA